MLSPVEIGRFFKAANAAKKIRIAKNKQKFWKLVQRISEFSAGDDRIWNWDYSGWEADFLEEREKLLRRFQPGLSAYQIIYTFIYL